jgi:hypothetical protein
MGELHPTTDSNSPDGKADGKALIFLVVTLGIAALELWGLIRLF